VRGRLRIYSKCCRLKESVVDESDYWRDNGGEGVVEDAYWLVESICLAWSWLKVESCWAQCPFNKLTWRTDVAREGPCKDQPVSEVS
jgi:hypothetical protein